MRFNWLESKVVSMLFFWSVVVCVNGFTYALFIAVPRVRQFFNSSSGNNVFGTLFAALVALTVPCALIISSALSAVLDERGRRRFSAAEARSYGFGGVSVVARVTGMARSTIARGVEEIEQKPEIETGRVRKPGGGRKPKQVADSTRSRPRGTIRCGRCCGHPKVCDTCLRR
jgi:hypothetical protein